MIHNFTLKCYVFVFGCFFVWPKSNTAQSFRTVPFQSEVLHTFTNPVTCPDRECYVSYKTDSFFYDNGDTVYVFDYIVKPETGLPGACTHTTKGLNWIGRLMRREHVWQSIWWNKYINSNGDTLQFLDGHHYNVPDSFTVMQYPDGSTIDLVREYFIIPGINAFGLIEESRPHVFHYFDSNRVEQPHIINGHKNIVSWHLGYFLALNFLNFPNDTSKYIEAGVTRSLAPHWHFLDTLNIKTQHIFDINLGDEFHYEITNKSGDTSDNTTATIYERKMLIGKETLANGDTLNFTWFRIRATFDENSLAGSDTSLTIDTITETIVLSDYPWLETPPNGFIATGRFGAGYMEMFREQKYAWRTQKNPQDFFNYDNANDCLSPKTAAIQPPRHHYAHGLGLTYYYEEFANPQYNSTALELVFFQKGLQEWGEQIVFSFLLPVDEVAALPTSVRIYPNPTPGLVTVFLNETTSRSNVHAEIFTASGESVWKSEIKPGIGELQIDLGDRASGVYLLRIFSEDGLLFGTKKIIKR